MKVTASCQWVGIIVLLLSLSVLVLPGCSTHSSPPPNPAAQQAPSSGGGSPPPPVSSSPSQPAPTGSHALFYDFQDIPVPNEMNVLSSESSVYESGPFKTGILTLRGRVDLNSLINFFQLAMKNQGWKAKGSFRYRRSVMVFEKPDKVCVMNFYEKLYYSYVEIYVVPSGGQG